MKKSTILQIAGGLVLASAGMFVFFHTVAIGPLLKDMKVMPWWILATVSGLTIVTLWLRAVRWNLILPSSALGSRKELFGLVMIAFMINNFVPARLGEAARVLLLWKRNKFTAAQSVGSVILERVLDTIIFLTFFFLPAFFIPELRKALPVALPMACGAALVIVVLCLYAFFPEAIIRLCKKCAALLPQKLHQRSIKIGKELISNLDWIFSPSKCLIIIILSVAIIACHPAMIIVLARDASFSVLGGMFGAACAAIGAAIPLSPGYVGTLHAALIQGLTMTGLDPLKAGTATVLYHAVSYVTVTILGLFFFFKMKISFKEIGHAKNELDNKK